MQAVLYALKHSHIIYVMFYIVYTLSVSATRSLFSMIYLHVALTNICVRMDKSQTKFSYVYGVYAGGSE